VFSIDPARGVYASLPGEDTPRAYLPWEQLDQIRAEHTLPSAEELLAPSPSGEGATRGVESGGMGRLVTMSDLWKSIAQDLYDAVTPKDAVDARQRYRQQLPDAANNSGCWFVESVFSGKYEGWYAAPPNGVGGWLTTDPLKAKRYTEAEARAVAQALTYFHAPHRWSNWVATEHVFAESGSEGAV
jgi:hypothetical protein